MSAGLSRRDFLQRMLVGAASLAAADGAFSQNFVPPTTLWLERCGEAFLIDFSTANGYHAARYMLRDQQAGMMGLPSVATLEALAMTQTWYAERYAHKPFIVHSGLRMPETNRRTRDAAKNSEHLPDRDGVFRAADVRLYNVGADMVGDIALRMGASGVGVYPKDDFVHISGGRRRSDGAPRFWVGQKGLAKHGAK